MSLIDKEATDLVLYRAAGCAQCGQRGYQGRPAVHEVLVMNDELRALVLERAPADAIALQTPSSSSDGRSGSTMGQEAERGLSHFMKLIPGSAPDPCPVGGASASSRRPGPMERTYA